MHLAHPLGVKGWSYRRVKNDAKDAQGLADLLRMNRLPESWIAPPPVRELRELVRHRAKLVALRSGLKSQVHAVLAKNGVAVPMTDLFGKAGMQLIADLRLGRAYQLRVSSLLDLIDAADYEVDLFTRTIAEELKGHPGYRAIQAIGGVGPTFAAVFVAEIGDVTRFKDAAALCSWAGLTPRHRESDTTVHRGHITKQGSRLVRWAAVEAVQTLPITTKLWADRDSHHVDGAAPPQPGYDRTRPPFLPPPTMRCPTATAPAAPPLVPSWPQDQDQPQTRPLTAPVPSGMTCVDTHPSSPGPASGAVSAGSSASPAVSLLADALRTEQSAPTFRRPDRLPTTVGLPAGQQGQRGWLDSVQHGSRSARKALHRHPDAFKASTRSSAG